MGWFKRWFLLDDVTEEIIESIMNQKVRKYRLLEYTNFHPDGSSHYNIKRQWMMGGSEQWTSINDDYGFNTLEEAEKVLESLRQPTKPSETKILKEVEYE